MSGEGPEPAAAGAADPGSGAPQGAVPPSDPTAEASPADRPARSDAPAGAPRATHDEILGAASLDELVDLYRARGAEGDRDAVLRAAQVDWHRVARDAARGVGEPPAALPALSCERAGVRYDVYGVIHGMIGGDDAEYKAFVDRTIGVLPHALFENVLGYFYPHTAGETIPDFAVFGAGGSVVLGLEVGLKFPLLAWELLRELIKRPRGRSLEEGFDFDPRYHAVEAETRRGLDEDPPLPAHLQIEYEMARWGAGGLRAAWSNPMALVPRSLFMAGYAVGYAERAGAERVALVLGDLHTTEVVRFLDGAAGRTGRAWDGHPLFGAGRRFAARPRLRRRLSFVGAKAVHLLASGATGALVLVPVVLAAVWLVWG